MCIMMCTGTVSLLLVLLSFGWLRNFCVQHIISHSSRFIIRALGYKFNMPCYEDFPRQKVMYTFNHPSYLDIFMLTALGLPNLRFFLTEKVIKYIPVTISALAIGTFYIPQQHNHERRVKFLKKYTKFFRKHDLSLLASAEGVQDHRGGIAPFNKGVFHLAMDAGLPVVMLFLNIPEESNPHRGEYSESGAVSIEIIGRAETKDWKQENLSREINKIRQIFVNKYEETHNKEKI